MGIAGDFVVVVVAGLVGGILARFARLPLLVGYIAAGVAVGPYTAGPTITNVHDIELLAELGAALLLFAIGLEVSLRDLGPVRRIALIGGPLQILVTTAFGASVFRLVTGAPWQESIWFGSLSSLSSTMVVLKVLSSDGTLATLASRVMIGILVVQDLAVLPMLIVLPQLDSMGSNGLNAAKGLGLAALFIVGMVVVGTRLLPAILRRVLTWGSRELFLVAVVAVGVGVGFITYQLGLSFALGAFVAGIVLSETELSHQALSDVVPLRDVFSLVFFVSVGMLLDPRSVVANAGMIAAIVVAVIVGKALVSGWITRAFGYVYSSPWIVGLGLAQIGEFGFVLARAGRSSGHLSQTNYELALASTVLSMTMSPIVFRAAIPLSRAWLRRFPPRASSPAPIPTPAHVEGHVVVAGYGRTGRAVLAALQRAEVPAIVLELNHQVSEVAVADGHNVVWGDMSSDTILEAARITSARALIVAVPDWSSVRLGIARAKELNPSLFIVARASAARHLRDLASLGVETAVQPEFEGGVEMMRQTLRHFERPDDEIERLAQSVRQDLYGR
jgi:monovalent cation:H+ antiporter-2, CPA2 family